MAQSIADRRDVDFVLHEQLEVTMQTSVDWIFAGGDAVLGPQTAAKAAFHGKEAAESIVRFFEGRDLKEGRISNPNKPLFMLSSRSFAKKPRTTTSGE